MTSPIPFQWDGETMRPLRGFRKRCDELFVVGEVYPLVEQEHRSMRSHGHYFAVLNDAWANLPEHLAERFPTSEHLRKFALIKAGYANSRTFTASSKAEATRLAAFIRSEDEFTVVTVSGATVTHWTARSQSMKAMGREEFQRSKDSVLSILEEMLGTGGRLAEAGGKAA